jgi:hypothetical protein
MDKKKDKYSSDGIYMIQGSGDRAHFILMVGITIKKNLYEMVLMAPTQRT